MARPRPLRFRFQPNPVVLIVLYCKKMRTGESPRQPALVQRCFDGTQFDVLRGIVYISCESISRVLRMTKLHRKVPMAHCR